MKAGTKSLMVGVVMAMTSTFAYAAVAPEGLTKQNIRSQIGALVNAGTYSFAEIKFAPGQVKVETITPQGVKVETVYSVGADGETLVILTSETEPAEARELGRAGLQVASVTRPFVDGDDDSDDDSDDDGIDSDDDDDSDDSDDDTDDDPDDSDIDTDDDGDDDNS